MVLVGCSNSSSIFVSISDYYFHSIVHTGAIIDIVWDVRG